MKIINLAFFLFAALLGNAQSLPIDFEAAIGTSDFIDFDGGVATVIANPHSTTANNSATVAKIVRNGGAVWAGSKIDLAANLDFTSMNSISMKVFTSAPVGTIVKFKLEGNGTTERDIPTTVANEWETLTWDFTGEPTDFNSIVFMFDFGNVGDSSINSTFFFDDIEQLFGGFQVDLPVDFEDSMVNYTMTDFGGNVSSWEIDPTNANNQVIKAIKTDQAATWAGTTIGTSSGFATNIPLSLSESKMTVRVWSPDAGTPIRLKVENSNDPTQTCETETNTTVSAAWETLEFDFANEAPGTAALSFGLSSGWSYNMASIFFNFGTEGSTAGEKTYYFDDVMFGESMVDGIDDYELEGLDVYPNPTDNQWTISIQNKEITLIEVFDLQGKLIYSAQPSLQSTVINSSNLPAGIYPTKISTKSGVGIVKLVKN